MKTYTEPIKQYPVMETCNPLFKSTFKDVIRQLADDILKASFFLVMLALFLPAMLMAQVYPVQVVSVSGDSRFSASINEMAGGSPGKGAFSVTLSLNDATVGSRDVYLKVGLNGGNINTFSRPDVYLTPAMVFPLTQLGGTINGTDFGQYLDPDNQLNLGYFDASKPLAEGVYRLSVEVYDVETQRKISNTAFFTFFIQQLNPPIVILPRCGGSTQSGTPITFTWQPVSVFGPMVTIDYELQIVWIETGGTNATLAFTSADPGDIHIFPTTATSIQVSTGEMLFQNNQNYGFRVLARASVDGTLVTLNNNGFSNVCMFTYKGEISSTECVELATLNGWEASTSNSVSLNWTLDPSIAEQPNQRYKVAYRPYSGAGTTVGFSSKLVTSHSHTFSGLKPNTQYQVYVKPFCVGTTIDSIVREFTTPAIVQEFRCGEEPVQQNNILGNLLTHLSAGEVIYVNNLPVVINSNMTANSSGQFNGVEAGGITFVFKPMQEFTPGINVTFVNVVVDTDYKVIDGMLKSTYDAEWKGVIDVDALFQGGSLQAELMSGSLKVDQTIAGVIESPKDISLSGTTVTIAYKKDGKLTTQTYTVQPGQPSVVVMDNQNKYYAVDTATGEVKYLGTKYPDTSTLFASFDKDEINEANKVAFSQFVPTDNTITEWAFDPGEPDPYFGCSNYGSEYSTIRMTSGSTYYVPWKFVPTGSTGGMVNVTLAGDQVMDNYMFVTSFGSVLTPVAGVLTLPPGDDQTDYTLYAIYKGVKNTQVGQLRVRSESPKTYPVTLVPMVAGMSLGALEGQLNKIYAPYAITWQVAVDHRMEGKTDWDVEGDVGVINTGDKFLSEYSADQISLHTYFKEQNTTNYDTSRSYVFLFDNAPVSTSAEGIESGAALGDMPINRRWGYLFSGTNDDRSLAHELGHGRLTLRHTFAEEICNANPGHTQNHNLMDYGSGTALNRFQWEAIHNPALVGNVFQDDEDGALMTNMPDYFAQRIKWPNGKNWGIHEDAVPIIDDNEYVIAFITPDQKVFLWINDGTWTGYFENGVKSRNKEYIFYVQDLLNRAIEPISWGIYLAATDLGSFAIELIESPIETTKGFATGVLKIVTLDFDLDKTWERICNADLTDGSYVVATIALSYLAGPKGKGAILSEDVPKCQELLEELAPKTSSIKKTWPEIKAMLLAGKNFETLVSQKLKTIFKVEDGFSLTEQVYLKVDGVVSIADDIIFDSRTREFFLNETKLGVTNQLTRQQKIIQDAVKAGKEIEIRSLKGIEDASGNLVRTQGQTIKITKILRSNSVDGTITSSTIKTVWP